MDRNIKTAVIDFIDDTYLRFTRHDRLPPFSLRGYVGPRDEFEQTPAEYIGYLKFLCGLKMDGALLDIGCGVGRVAMQLVGSPHFFRGHYCGFDIDARAIDWAKRNIETRHPNTQFTRVDLGNTHYNPSGSQQAANFVYPYDDDCFDVAIAISVFTHLLPAAAINYLRETRRTLKRGGTALFTFILLQDRAEELSDLADARRARRGPRKWHHFDGYAVLDPSAPEAVLAYQEAWLRQAVEQAGLRIDRVCRGSWTHRDDTLAFQDIVILAKP